MGRQWCSGSFVQSAMFECILMRQSKHSNFEKDLLIHWGLMITRCIFLKYLFSISGKFHSFAEASIYILYIYIYMCVCVSLRGHFKNTCKIVNLEVLKSSLLNKLHIFQRMGKIFCVEFQRVPLKFHIKYLTHTLNHTLKDTIFIQWWNFKSSQTCKLVSHTQGSVC